MADGRCDDGQTAAALPSDPPPAYSAFAAEKDSEHMKQGYAMPPPGQPGFGYIAQPAMMSPNPGMATYPQTQPYPNPAVPQYIIRGPVLQQPHVPDHMMLSVLSTLLCCWVVGIFAIIKSLKVREDLNRGDIEGAKQSSASAYQLSKIAIIIGTVTCVVTVVIFILIFVFSASLY